MAVVDDEKEAKLARCGYRRQDCFTGLRWGVEREVQGRGLALDR
jgi:hypothetical protein